MQRERERERERGRERERERDRETERQRQSAYYFTRISVTPFLYDAINARTTIRLVSMVTVCLDPL